MYRFFVYVHPEDPQPFHIYWESEADGGTLGRQSHWSGVMTKIVPLITPGDTFHIRVAR